MMEQSDSKYFSQRAKHISLLKDQSSPKFVKASSPPPPPSSSSSSSEMYFQFSNRSYVPKTDTQLIPVGRGHGCSISNNHHQSVTIGRGRTTVPLSSFILQNDKLSSPSTTNIISPPIFVMHDEVQFVRPYFGPPSNSNIQSSSLASHKRDVLLSALKEIESGLKTL